MNTRSMQKKGGFKPAYSKTRFFQLALGMMCILFVSLLNACTKYETLESANSAGLVLPGGTVIDGVELGGLSIDEASAALERQHAELEKQTVYEVYTGGSSLRISAEQLPFIWKSDEALLMAVNRSFLSTKEELSSTMTISSEACRAALFELCAPFSCDAINASFSYENGVFDYREEKDGQSLELVSLAKQILALPFGKTHKINAVLTDIKPVYTLENAKADTELLAEFSTSFAHGNYGAANRVFNMKKAAALIDGTVLKSGEEFDMNAILGARNKENGWREATAIREGSYVQEYGGGVCQVSTTLYNAVLMADLPVTQRYHHSWPLGYIDIGRDATISTGGPNFKFTNAMQSPVYISAIADTKAKTVTVRLYGHLRGDGITIKLRSEKVALLDDPGNEVRVDKTLAAGVRQVERESRAGSISETYKQYYSSDGKLIREELVSRDKYRPVKGIILVASEKAKSSEQAAAAWAVQP